MSRHIIKLNSFSSRSVSSTSITNNSRFSYENFKTYKGPWTSCSVDCRRMYALNSRGKPKLGLAPAGACNFPTRLGLNSRWCGHKCITHQECWKCGQSIEPDLEQYFCVCGVVQPPLKHRSYFQIFGIEEQFDVNEKRLAEKHKKLQVLLHPDKYNQKCETEKVFSAQHSSVVGEAYQTLLNPLSRGLYLLNIKGEDLENEIQIDTNFLAEVLEINESIQEAKNLSELTEIKKENVENIRKLIHNVSEAFKKGDGMIAKENLLKLKYMSNISDKIIAVTMDGHMVE